MFLNNSGDFQTVWQLAHNWVNVDPENSDPNALSVELRQAIHRLLVAIANRDISARTKNIVILNNDDVITVLFDARHRRKISKCLTDNKFDKTHLDSIYVKRNEVLDWCAKAYLDPPSSWAPKNLVKEQVVSESADSDDDQDGWYEKLTERRKQRITLLEVAKQLWKHEPDLNYSQIYKHKTLRDVGYASSFTFKIFKKWVRPFAPESAKAGGRPIKSKK